jgi:hypothetical protein
MAMPVGHGGIERTSSREFVPAPHAEAAQRVRDLIKVGNIKEADELLHTWRTHHSAYKAMNTFDALLETVLEDPTVTDRYVKGAQFCRMLETQGLDSDTSRLFLQACLLTIGNTKGAEDEIKRHGYSEGLSSGLKTVYVTLGKADMIALLDALDAFAASLSAV